MRDIDVSAAKLEEVLAKQDHLYGVEREEGQHANLIYALKEIRPTRHTELALVVWAGTRYRPVNTIVDEYCRRRAGSPPLLFDHHLMSLREWCMPDTCRLLVFREQLEALAKQLTGGMDGRKIVRGIGKFSCGDINGISQDDFREMVNSNEGLSLVNIKQFYDYLGARFDESLPYTWCSTIAERSFIVDT